MSLTSLTTQTALVLVVAFFQSTLSYSSQTECPDQCECQIGIEMCYICRAGGAGAEEITFLTGSSRRGDYLRVECNGKGYRSEDLPQMNLLTSSQAMLEIFNCTLPYEPISRTLTKISSGTIFQNITFNLVKNFPSNLFQNLTDQIIRLTFLQSLTEIPDFVKDLEKLYAFEVSKSAVLFDLRNLPKSLVNLNFMQTSLQKITPGSLRHLKKLRQLQLNRNNLTEINEEMFEGLSELKVLSLMGNQIREVRRNTFNNLKSLEQLDMTENPIELIEKIGELPNLYYLKANNNHGKIGTIIANRSFANLPSLREVNLRYFNIKELAMDAFEGTSALKKIDISHNRLIIFPTTLLTDQKSLEFLDLGYNKIRQLSADSFKSLNNLKTLVLSNNEITSLPRLYELRSLEKLSIRGNNLTALFDVFSDMIDFPLMELDLSNNQLEFYCDRLDSPLSSLTRLKKLKLASNRITSLCSDWLFTLLRLESLDLSYNYFTELQTVDFANIIHKLEINLTNNNITTIDMQPNPSNQNADVTIHLKNNPFNCNCEIYSFIENIKTYPNIKTDGATCSTPQSLRNVPVLEVKPSALYCDYDCPLDCVCKISPASDTNYMTCRKVPDPDQIPEQTVSHHISLRLTQLDELPTYLSPIISTLNLSSLNLTYIPVMPVNHSLQTLDLSSNRLSYIPELFLQQNFSLLISKNPLACDCWHASYLSILDKCRSKILDYNSTRCGGTGELVTLTTFSQLCAPLFMVIAVMIACVGMMAALVVAMYYRNEMEIKAWLYHKGWFLSLICEEDLDKDKKWDVFISYAFEDEAFVVSELEPRLLEPPHSYKVCLHFREWGAGFITEHITSTVAQSRRVVLVLSRAFLHSTWCAAEFRAAHQQSTEDKRLRLIIILVEDISDVPNIDPELKAYLKTNTYIQWGTESAWKKLMYALPHRNIRERTKNQKQYFKNLKFDTTLSGLKREDVEEKDNKNDKGEDDAVFNNEMLNKMNNLKKNLDLSKELVIDINDLEVDSSGSNLQVQLRPNGKMLPKDVDKFDAKKV